MKQGELLLTFYGDDFTGSTDVMEALSIGGVPTALFLEPPGPEQLSGRFASLRAVGVPGLSRSMTPQQMRTDLPPIFRQIAGLGAKAFHYKVCSTFDSSPEIGSIGCAIDLARELFDSGFIPLVVGAPALNRFMLFGNLFARVAEETYRLDRHPTMSKHPVTPMLESDLRVHLGKQTSKSIALFDILQQTGDPAEVDARLARLLGDDRSLRGGPAPPSGPDIVMFDVLDDDRLTEVGRLIWSRQVSGPGPMLMVGSSGIEYALTRYWQRIGQIDHIPQYPSPGPVDQLIVVSGSCSPTTAAQIEWAVTRGAFAQVALDTPALASPDTAEAARRAAVVAALRLLSEGAGRSLVMHSACGPDDPRIDQTKDRLRSAGQDPADTGERIGQQLGLMLREILERTGLRRALVTGGDTSGHAARQLGIYALELVVPIAPGAPLCRASSNDPRFDGLQLSLKGGQNGKADYFGCIREGRRLS